MIPKECKRLIEVDFPIAVVSKHSAREKSIRHGHPSTLHLWWARRPLAACRAVLLGLLFPDPCDEHCPEEFKEKAKKILAEVQGEPQTDEDLRRGLLKFIGDFANWDLSSHPTYLKASRELVKTAHGEEPPLVVDPFAGGGSIPLEALRVGCETFASDLNPVACLILKTMLEDIPRHGPRLAEELRRVGKEVKEKAEKELAEFYPDDPDGGKPIAYLWARTVRCESPGCGAEIPLVRSFWLCKKARRRRALRPKILRPSGKTPYVEFEIYEPKSESDVPKGTVSRAKATCLCCPGGSVLPPDRVRAQLREQKGGADVIFDEKGRRVGGARLLAVVTLHPQKSGRQYRLPTEKDYEVVYKARKALEKIASVKLSNGLSPIPDEPLPPQGTLGFRVQLYGMLQWGDLFSARQKLALVTLVKKISRLSAETEDEIAPKKVMSFVVSKLAERLNAQCDWMLDVECVGHLFTQHAIPQKWDFAESNVISGSSGSIGPTIENTAQNVESAIIPQTNRTISQLADSCVSPLPDESCLIWFTDPPYYDAITYADLSDFFFVWMKRVLPGLPFFRDPFDQNNPLTPKVAEIVQDNTRQVNGVAKNRVFFEQAMTRAFTEGRRILGEGGIGCVIFAHKTTEGWEALLSGILSAGWVITASWPITTERYSRMRARNSAALASSVHLVCRPRPSDASVGDWGEVLRELPNRVGDWIDRLQREGIRGADLVFACIGPALEIFSRYSKVETAEGGEVTLAEYLEKIWEVVGRIALEQVLGISEARARNSATAGALEEDARLTALFLWTLQSAEMEENGNDENGDDDEVDEGDDEESSAKTKKKGFSLIFDVVRRFAQPLGIHLEDWKGRVIEIEKGVVRLLPVSERASILFGADGAEAVADRFEATARETRQIEFDFLQERREVGIPEIRGRGRRRKRGPEVIDDEALTTHREATTLDRVHAAMLLQKAGRTNALRSLISTELNRGPDFLRLANALSALYPKESEEKRLIDAMLLAVPR